MPMDPKMAAMMGGGPDPSSPDSVSPDAVQSAFDAIRAAIDDAERQIVMGRQSDVETPVEESAPDEETD